MTKAEEIKSKLISQIETIENESFLLALESFLSSNVENSDFSELTLEQELMLAMSEEDISKGRTISQDDLKIKTSQWLANKKD